jgi:hypothetical protein
LEKLIRAILEVGHNVGDRLGQYGCEDLVWAAASILKKHGSSTSHMWRRHRSSTDRSRASVAVVPRSENANTRSKDINTASKVRKGSTGVILVRGCNGGGRRRVAAGVTVVVSGCNCNNNSGSNHALHSRIDTGGEAASKANVGNQFLP